MLRKLVFLLLFILFVSVNFYIYIRGSQAIPANIAIHALYTILFLVCVLSFFIAILFEGKLPGFIISIFESIGGYWMITILYFLVAVLLADFIRLTATLFNIFPNTIKSNSAQIKGIYGGFVLLVGIVFSIIGYIRFLHPQTVILNLDINKNIDQPEQLSIVAVSDLHLGNIIRKRHLVKYVEMINRKQPDLILIAGDLIDRNLVSVEAQQLDQVLLKLKATYGVYAVVGNHDYFRNIEKTIQFMVKSNINVLRDRAVI